MNRRDAIQHISLLLGGTILGAEAFLSGCKSNADKTVGFSEKDVALLDEIADTILPPTKTPGAKAAKVGELMKVMVNDCYEEKDQQLFHDGMGKIQDLADKEYGNNFMEIKPEQRHALLVKLDNEQKAYTKTKKAEDPPHYFRLMKELTLLGYFTSEIGCKEARRYQETPGRWDACIPYKKGDRAWT
ncbi:MAG: gluconate 2-dehydrogenase subunit 3 family protein [Williamsia sp.]|nr:gluconate 2-dehydrogenase subunit 3 family protein [Williamsia sp.]